MAAQLTVPSLEVKGAEQTSYECIILTWLGAAWRTDLCHLTWVSQRGKLQPLLREELQGDRIAADIWGKRLQVKDAMHAIDHLRPKRETELRHYGKSRCLESAIYKGELRNYLHAQAGYFTQKISKKTLSFHLRLIPRLKAHPTNQWRTALTQN